MLAKLKGVLKRLSDVIEGNAEAHHFNVSMEAKIAFFSQYVACKIQEEEFSFDNQTIEIKDEAMLNTFLNTDTLECTDPSIDHISLYHCMNKAYEKSKKPQIDCFKQFILNFNNNLDVKPDGSWVKPELD